MARLRKTVGSTCQIAPLDLVATCVIHLAVYKPTRSPSGERVVRDLSGELCLLSILSALALLGLC